MFLGKYFIVVVKYVFEGIELIRDFFNVGGVFLKLLVFFSLFVVFVRKVDVMRINEINLVFVE